QLQPTHDDQLRQVAQVQTGRSRVEPAVIGDRLPAERFAQRLSVGRDVHAATPQKFIPDILERGIELNRSRCLHGFHRTAPRDWGCAPLPGVASWKWSL